MQRKLIMIAIAMIATASTWSRAAQGVSVSTPEAKVQLRTDGTISVKVDEDAVNASSGAGAKYAESKRGGIAWLSFENNGQAGTVDCQKRHVLIAGNGSQLVLQGECPFVEVSGDDNQVTIKSAGKISVAGDGNMVTWKQGIDKAKPKISDSGANNLISRG